MRNVFLTLVLANLLLLAWQFWVDPAPPATSVTGPNELVLFSDGAGPPRRGATASPTGTCLRVGPLPDVAAAQQASQQLAARGIDAIPIARESQLWLGHWVQIRGFASAPEAEAARQRMVAGGLTDAYLMQDGTEAMISLGVFRDRGRADRVAGAAQALGLKVSVRDRYRPAVEEWLLIRPRRDQSPQIADLRLAGDRIMRTESAPCEATGMPLLPASEPTAPAAAR